MVYSAAQRIVRDGHLAEEVAQAVFTTLAEKAGAIRASQVVGGWLYNTTRHLAMHAVRTEQRRRERERAALVMQSINSGSDTDRINDQLEPAMAELEANDRDALVLRYLENRSLREVGEDLGIAEDAARMRVNRALERLRGVLERRGVAVTSVLLATIIGSSTSTVVPAALGATITSTAAAAVTAATLTQSTIITTMNLLNAKAVAAIAGAALLAGSGTYFVQQQKINRENRENRALIAQREKLTADHETALALIRAREQELEGLRQELAEVPAIKNQLAQMRRQNEAEKKVGSRQTAKSAEFPKATAAVAPGKYISKEQLAFAGYATPEAALQSMTWAMISGNYESTIEGLSPELQAEALNDPKDRETFETGLEKEMPLFKGMQIAARKVLGDEKVELKVKMDADPHQDRPNTTEFMIQTMVKIGSEWKLGGSTREYHPNWDKTGDVQMLSP
jgi:RNA polymerase sigma factor (sigma-70 family)